MKKAKRYKYFASLQWAENESKFSMATQLYDCAGVYVAISRDNRPDTQFGFDPKRFGKKQQEHIDELRARGVEVTTGREVLVYENEEGYWAEDKGE